MRLDPKELGRQIHPYLTEAVSPRPIAFVSTVDKNGQVNLSPFSFFNVFSGVPPVAVFSPALRGRDGFMKDTLLNLKEVGECTISIVNHEMVEQMSLASAEYAREVDEFVKSGFTPVDSELVKTPGVKESPIKMECKVREIVSLGDQGGAGQLVICDILLMHVDDAILDDNKHIDPNKLDAVGRMGGNYYVRASGDAIFEIEKPIGKACIGFDNIPEHIKSSTVLTGSNLGQLGNVEALPDQADVTAMAEGLKSVFGQFAGNSSELRQNLHEHAKDLLEKGDVVGAWKVLLTETL